MVPQSPDEIVAAALAKLADVERRLSDDAASLADDRWRDGADRLAALRRAADDVRKELDRSPPR